MFLKKVLSIIKLFFLKLRYGKRLKISSIRQNLRVDTEIVVGKDAFLSLDRVSFRTNVHLLCDHGEMHIGSRVCFNRNCIIACRYRIKIGDRCLFGPNVCIYDHDHAYTSDGVSTTEFKCSEIIIEDGCWIGAGAIILRGTHIGKNSVIEAGAVVKGDIPPNSLVTTIRETRVIPTTLFAGKRKIYDNH
jgi:acetyltransferase-like isoleucine patch superfamily enzyme